MTREFLKKLFEGKGIDDAAVDAIMAENGKDVEARKGAEADAKGLRDSLGGRDAQLEELKASAGQTEALKQQIADLQAANKAADEAHAKELLAVKVDAAVSSALAGARARNPETVKPLLKAFLEKAELGDDGKVKGLDEEVRKLSEGGDTKFLFEERGQAHSFKGLVPGEGGDREQAPQTFEDAVKAHFAAEGGG